MILRLLAIAALPFAIGTAGAQEKGPLYAVYDSELEGPKLSVRIVNVGIIPNRDMSTCERQLQANSRGRAKSPDVAVRVLSSSCQDFLPRELAGIEKDRPIKDAYVVKVQPNNFAPVYAAWFGLDTSNPRSTCEGLLNDHRSRMDPKILMRVQLSCLTPVK